MPPGGGLFAATVDSYQLYNCTDCYDTRMGQKNEMLDLSHCLRKEMEYYAKAAAVTDNNLKTAYEAAAREYRYRATLLQRTNVA